MTRHTPRSYNSIDIVPVILSTALSSSSVISDLSQNSSSVFVSAQASIVSLVTHPASLWSLVATPWTFTGPTSRGARPRSIRSTDATVRKHRTLSKSPRRCWSISPSGHRGDALVLSVLGCQAQRSQSTALRLVRAHPLCRLPATLPRSSWAHVSYLSSNTNTLLL